MDKDQKPSKYLKKALKESELDRKKRNCVSFDSKDKALKFIDEILNEDLS